jgi:hypothetical protein
MSEFVEGDVDKHIVIVVLAILIFHAEIDTTLVDRIRSFTHVKGDTIHYFGRDGSYLITDLEKFSICSEVVHLPSVTHVPYPERDDGQYDNNDKYNVEPLIRAARFAPPGNDSGRHVRNDDL